MNSIAGPSRTDLMYEITYNPKFVPDRSPRVSVKQVIEGKETRNLMRIGSPDHYGAPQFYDLDKVSNIVWGLIDGKRTVDEIVAQAQGLEKLDDPDAATHSLLFFAESEALVSQANPAIRRRVRVVSSFITEVTLIWDGTRILGLVHRLVRPLLRGFLFWVSMAVVAAGVIVFAPRFGAVLSDPNNFRILGSTVVGFLFYNFIILGPVIVIHELSHGLALVHYSGRAGEIGTGLFYFGPMFYVDATGYWSLPRRQRTMMMWAGNLSTLLIGSTMVLSRLVIPYPPAIAKTLDVAAFWCFYSTLWNLAPPLETDGYHILADIVSIPSLRGDGLNYLKSTLLRFIGRSPPEGEELSVRKKRILFGYSLFSVALLGYIVFQSLRFTSYMAADVASWATRIGASLASNTLLLPAEYAVGIVSIVYFALTVSGYGVLVQNQVKKSLVRGLRFEAVHDRNLSVFFYLPEELSISNTIKFVGKIRSITKGITPNSTVGRQGPLSYATLRIGGTSLPLKDIRKYLRNVERDFLRTYERLVVNKSGAVATRSVRLSAKGESLNSLLVEMARNTSIGERQQVTELTREFLERQRKNVGYLLDSTFLTVWTIELPPLEEYELLGSLVPRLFVEDLMMTNLLDEEEEFKKRVVYGLDSVAQLSAEASEVREKALAHPEKYQLISLFEPVRGRVIFLGRTERVERDIQELGPLLILKIWGGHLDNLLGDASLDLQAIVQSFVPVPANLGDLKDGEVFSLNRYVSSLASVEDNVFRTLADCRETVKLGNSTTKRLKKLFEPTRQSRIGQFDSILALNNENLSSIPYGLAEVGDLLKQSFEWVRSFEGPISDEHTRRESIYLATRGRMSVPFAATSIGSASVLLAGIFLPGVSFLLLPSLAVLGATQVAWATAFYQLRASSIKVSRYPSETFSEILAPLYALTQTLSKLAAGVGIVNPAAALRRNETHEEKWD